ncbi:MAG: hypothetical protein KGV56_05060 [Gammaproteobacteria bacterium]|nr:hypothetical protein [Gammaproteobacteria bacterium]
MAYETGTASDYQDLQNRIVTFVTTNSDLVANNQNWELLKQDGTSCYLKAPGLSGTESIYCGLDVISNATNDYYNMLLYGSRGFVANEPLSAQPFSGRHVILLWNKSIKYWLIANGQRLIIVAKISTNYEMAYVGKIFPYATPKQYPYPLLIAGTGSKTTLRWDSNEDHHTSLQSPYGGSDGATGRLYLNDGESALTTSSYRSSSEICINPNKRSYKNIIVQQNTDGTYTLIPFVLYSDKDGGNILGEIDGIYWVTGHNNASENIITIDNVDYLVVQNTFRTGWQDYCAVALV